MQEGKEVGTGSGGLGSTTIIPWVSVSSSVRGVKRRGVGFKSSFFNCVVQNTGVLQEDTKFLKMLKKYFRAGNRKDF